MNGSKVGRARLKPKLRITRVKILWINQQGFALSKPLLVCSSLIRAGLERDIIMVSVRRCLQWQVGQGGLTRPGGLTGTKQYRLRNLAEDQVMQEGELFRITGTLPEPKQDRHNQRAAETANQ
jgi:hypothetical protein